MRIPKYLPWNLIIVSGHLEVENQEAFLTSLASVVHQGMKITLLGLVESPEIASNFQK